MNRYALSHLADSTLLHDLAALVARDRATTAELLAHLAECDARQLYLPAAYPSMYAYCVGELRMSEDTAYKRIRAARAARRFPAIFPAVAEGRLTLSAVVLLAPHLTEATAEALLAAAVHRTKSEVELLLAARFPRPDLPTVLEAVSPAPASATCRPPDPAMVATMAPRAIELAPGPVAPAAPAPIEVPRPRVTALAPARYALQVTIDQETHDQLRYAQALLGHAVPSGDLAAVLKQVLGTAIAQLERGKFAAGARSGPRRGPGAPAGRYIPAEVPAHGLRARRRAVHVRERGRPALPGAASARVRSCRGIRARRRGDGGGSAAPLSGA